MSYKVISSYLTKRIITLILVLLLIVLLWVLTFDPHKYCVGDDHRHVDGGLGMVITLLITTMAFCCFLFFEMVWMYYKKKGNFAIVDLILFLIIAFIIYFIFHWAL